MPGVGPFGGALVPQEDGKVTLFAEGKFVVPPGENAVIQMTETTGNKVNKSCPVVAINSTHKEVFMLKKPRDPTDERIPGGQTGGQKPICDAAGVELFAVTNFIYGEKDDPSVYWEEAGQAKSFTVSKTRSGQRVCLTNMKGEEIELNGTVNWFDTWKNERGHGHIRLGDMESGIPIAKFTHPKEMPGVGTPNLDGPKGKTEDYLLEIAPGVDMALILAMVLAGEVKDASDRAWSCYYAAGG